MWVIKSKGKFDWACGSYIWGEVHTGFWWGKLKKRDRLEDLNVDGKKLKLVLNRMRVLGLKSCGFGQGKVAGCCEHGDEHSDAIKRRELPK